MSLDKYLFFALGDNCENITITGPGKMVRVTHNTQTTQVGNVDIFVQLLMKMK